MIEEEWLVGRKGGTCALCGLLLIQILASCAEMTEQQKGAAIGGGAGALAGGVLGGLVGGKKGAVVGTLTGGLVGGFVGWQVGEYRAQKIKGSTTAAAAHAYSPQQGVVAKIDKTAATPQQLKPGDQIVLRTDYTVLAPPEKGQVKVKEIRTILFNNQELGRVEKDSELATGTYETQHSMILPEDAAEGRYTVKTLVRALDVEKAVADQATTTFVVGATPAPVMTTRGVQPATLAPAASMPQAVYIQSAHANLREGPGTQFKVVAKAVKGNRFQVQGEEGKGNLRWYRVKLEDGREAWVASSVVSLEPQ